MMNKVITGGILVAVMGGVPGATYLLTREEKTNTNTPTNQPDSIPNPAPCVPKDNEPNSCPSKPAG